MSGTDESLVGEGCWRENVGADDPAHFAHDFLHNPEGVDTYRANFPVLSPLDIGRIFKYSIE